MLVKSRRETSGIQAASLWAPIVSAGHVETQLLVTGSLEETEGIKSMPIWIGASNPVMSNDFGYYEVS